MISCDERAVFSVEVWQACNLSMAGAAEMLLHTLRTKHANHQTANLGAHLLRGNPWNLTDEGAPDFVRKSSGWFARAPHLSASERGERSHTHPISRKNRFSRENLVFPSSQEEVHWSILETGGYQKCG